MNGNDILFEKYLTKQFPFVKSVSVEERKGDAQILVTLSPSHFCEVYFNFNTEDKVKDMMLSETKLLLWSLYPEIPRDSDIGFTFFPDLSNNDSILKFTNEPFKIF
jgi:hypothetical protein